MKNIARKSMSFILALMVMVATIATFGTSFKGEALFPDNLLTNTQSTFESITVPMGWGTLGGGILSISTNTAHSGLKSLKMTGRSKIWNSPLFNIYSILKNGGSGTYFVSLWIKADTFITSPSTARLLVRGAKAQDNSFINPYPCDDCTQTNYYAPISSSVSIAANTWTQLTGMITVQESDIVDSNGTFNLCLDGVGLGTNQNLYIDDVQLVKPITTVETLKNTEISFASDYTYTPFVAGNSSTFEDSALNGWGAFAGGQMLVSSTIAHSGNYSVKLNIPSCNGWETWLSPYKNIYDIIKVGGAGTYYISYWVYADNLLNNTMNGRMIIRANTAGSYSFLQQGTSIANVSELISTNKGVWTQYFGKLTVTEADISGQTGTFNLMLDGLSGASPQNIYIDDFKIYKTNANLSTDLSLNVTFIGPNNTTVVKPAYWDSANIWKVSFAPSMEGIWNYSTSCSNTADNGLHGKTGFIADAAIGHSPLSEDIVTSSALISPNDLQKWIVEYTGKTTIINSVSEQVVNIKNKASNLYLTRNSNEGYVFATEKNNANYQDWIMVKNGNNLLISPADDITKYLNISTNISLSTELSPLAFAYPILNNLETTISEGTNYLQSGIIADFGSLSIIGAYIHNFTPSSNFKVSNIKAGVQFGKLTNYTFKKGVTILSDSDTAGTGTMLEITYPITATYTIVVYGDVSGDGNISVEDLAKIKRHLLKTETLSSVYQSAGDVNRNNFISISDLISIKKAILGINAIYQS